MAKFVSQILTDSITTPEICERDVVGNMLNPSQPYIFLYFSPEGAVGQTEAWMPTYVSILRVSQMI
jgi:hypothetical protein